MVLMMNKVWFSDVLVGFLRNDWMFFFEESIDVSSSNILQGFSANVP